MKKSFILVLSALIVSAFSITAFAGTDYDTAYSLDSKTGEFHLKSDSKDYNPTTGDHPAWIVNGSNDTTSWGPYQIKTVYVDEGVHKVGDYAFGYIGSWSSMWDMPNIETAYISSTVTSVGTHAFAAVQKDVYVYSDAVLFGDLWILGDVTIHAHAGSTAETYAKQHNINFVKMCMTHENTEVSDAIEPTCDSAGFSGIVTCTDCGTVIDEGHTLTALGHDYKTINKVDATCDSEGYTGDIVCSRCGDVQSKGHVSEALGHNWGVWNIITMPTCTETGENIRFCQRCEEYQTNKTKALGHSFGFEYITEKEATCISEGTEYRLCSRCKSEKDYRTIALTDHVWETQAKVDIKATCTSDGEESVHCANCSERKDITSIPATGHSYKTVTKASQIGIAGKTYDECENCGDTKNEKTIAAKLPAKTSITSVKATKKGFTVKWSKKLYTGYQIRYSVKSNMSKPKTITVTKNSIVSKKVTKLKVRKKYYIQVRTYKTVSGKKYYSAWSTKKSIKTK